MQKLTEEMEQEALNRSKILENSKQKVKELEQQAKIDQESEPKFKFSDKTSSKRRKPNRSIEPYYENNSERNTILTDGLETNDNSQNITAKFLTCNNNNIVDNEMAGVDGEEGDGRTPGSIKYSSRPINISKLVFNKEIKSKSNNAKSSRFTNTAKLMPLPPSFIPKKLLQTQQPKGFTSSFTSSGKNIDDSGSVKLANYSTNTETRTLPPETLSSFRKPGREGSGLFSKNSKNIVFGANYQYSSYDDKGGASPN